MSDMISGSREELKKIIKLRGVWELLEKKTLITGLSGKAQPAGLLVFRVKPFSLHFILETT
jgi:hypothetical protein